MVKVSWYLISYLKVFTLLLTVNAFRMSSVCEVAASSLLSFVTTTIMAA
jgi:hypothetical protein